MSTGKVELWTRLRKTFEIADQQCTDVRLGMSMGATAHEVAALRAKLIEETRWLMGSDDWDSSMPFAFSNGQDLYFDLALAGDDVHVRRAIDLAGEAGDLLADDATAEPRPRWITRGPKPCADLWFYTVVTTALERRPDTTLSATRTVNEVARKFGDHCYYVLLPISPIRASIYLIDLLLVDGAKLTREGMSWRDAMPRAEKHVKAHGGAFPSVKKLAEILGCSRPTIDKAISNSRYLKARQAQAKKWGHEVPLADVVQDATAQTTEGDPSELEALIKAQEVEMSRDERQAIAQKFNR